MLSSTWARSVRAVLVLSTTMMVAAMTLPAHAASLTQTWADRYVGGTDFQYAQSLAVSPDGSMVYVTGISAGPINEGDPYDAFATIAYDAATGDVVWLDRYSDWEIDNWASTVVVSPDGQRVYVTGLTPNGYPIVSYDAATGERLWVSHAPRDTGVGSDGELTVSPDSQRVYFTGEIMIGDGPASELLTAAFRASTGATIWSDRFAGPDGMQIRPSAIAIDHGGRRLYVAGTTGDLNQFPTPNPPDIATVSYQAASGVRRWVKLYDGPAHLTDFGQALVVAPNGRSVIVGGFSETSTRTYQSVVVSYRRAGGMAWATRSGTSSVNRFLSALTINRSGSTLYATGEQGPPGESWGQYRTMSLSASTGAIGWSRSYGTGVTADATAIAMSPDDAVVYVTGGTDTAALNFYTSYATVAYNASTGSQIAAARYTPSPTPSAFAESIGVSPSGAVFVTGHGGGAFATVAYKLG